MRKLDNMKAADMDKQVVDSKTREDDLMAMIVGDAETESKKREAEKLQRITAENVKYAEAINSVMNVIIRAGKRLTDLSSGMATKLFRDALKEFRFPSFEEIEFTGTPKIREDGSRLDGLRTDEDVPPGSDGKPLFVYTARSVEWRIGKIMRMLRLKTPTIQVYAWEKPVTFTPEPKETIAETAVIKPSPKSKSKANLALKSAKAKQA